MKLNQVTQNIANHLKTFYIEPTFVIDVFPNVGVIYIRRNGEIGDIKVEIKALYFGLFYAKFDDMMSKDKIMLFHISKKEKAILLMY